MSITVRAPAKINLHLAVGPLGDDGYHELCTVYQAIGLYDDVTAVDASHWSVEVLSTGDVDVAGVPLGATNLAVRAGQALARHHGLARAARLTVHKGIPVAGGLAGGSADAAATLVALDRLWGLETSDDDLLALAAELGSDVPFALLGGTVLGTGRGEVLEPLDDRGKWWWAVLPDPVGLATPEVYAAYDELGGPDGAPGGTRGDLSRPEELLEALATGKSELLRLALRNDLTAAALHLRPDLVATRDALAELYRDGPPLLSGSGPTWLAMCDDVEHVRDVGVPLLEAGRRVLLATGPVAGAHVVEHA